MTRVLVVEDNPNNMYLVGYILKKKGYEVIEAWNGLEGVRLAKSEKPDIILMDIQMPEMDGYEATNKIRETEGDDIPIIALTAHAMKGDREKALGAGCSGYIEKPIKPETFIDQVQAFLPEEKKGKGE